MRKYFRTKAEILRANIISELCELTQIKKLKTTPYQPEGNGPCERFNRMFISMLGTLPDNFKSKWTQHISTLVYAYNCTHSNATGLVLTIYCMVNIHCYQ